MKPFIELDVDQANVPAGYEAYILRSWKIVYSGVADSIDGIAENGLPHINWGQISEQRLPEYPGEVSRILAREGAVSDDALKVEAPPVPSTLAECHPRFPDRVNLGNQESGKA